jgi:nitroimidazol reductase NimA-like FMN-containing flavoprotein (pyridoxamine 5'-phosphate oxidase superfamily)
MGGMSTSPTDRNGLEVLEAEECVRLLAEAHLGRIGVTSGALPLIFPVNYRLDGDDLLFRTAVGTKLDVATRGTIVAFEVDDFDPVSHAGWSVVVTGRARRLSPEEAAERRSRAPVARWAPGPDGNTVAVSLDMVSGRRLPVLGAGEDGFAVDHLDGRLD